MRLDGRISKRMGVVAIVGGVWMAAGGIAIAYTGFSQLAMLINMPSTLLLIAWLFALAKFLWRGTAFRTFQDAV